VGRHDGRGVFEHAYGSAAKTLQATYNWGDTETFTLTGVWGFFQAGIALPAGRLRERNVFSARAAMLSGAVLCFLAFLTIGSTGNMAVVVLGYSVLGGIGAGLAGSVAAGPLAAALIDANGYPATYIRAGSFSLLAAALVLFLRQPAAVHSVMQPALASGEAPKT
jgi:hypothetical protein